MMKQILYYTSIPNTSLYQPTLYAKTYLFTFMSDNVALSFIFCPLGKHVLLFAWVLLYFLQWIKSVSFSWNFFLFTGSAVIEN